MDHDVYSREGEEVEDNNGDCGDILSAGFPDPLWYSGNHCPLNVEFWPDHICINIFAGHYMDQKRLKQGLYRHPWDDISYVLPEQYTNWRMKWHTP